MYLYYQDISPDYDLELIGQYESIEKIMLKIKEECDKGHKDCPEYIPCYEEFVIGDFSKYPDYQYVFHIPTVNEIKNMLDYEYIYIIRAYIDDSYAYLLSKQQIDKT